MPSSGAKTLFGLLGELDVTAPLANLGEADRLQLSLDFAERQRPSPDYS
jgi:hypothetical protein